MEPFNSFLDLSTGEILACTSVVVRRVSDMDGVYQNREATQRLIREGNPVVYRVYNVPVPEERGHLQHCASVIYPGKVGAEYHMTKGHFHAQRGTGEIYLGLQGEGKLLLQDQQGGVNVLDMKPGSVSYIPPHWAHRTVNVGKDPLVFFAVYPGEAGHDYGSIEEKGFAQLIVERDGRPAVVPNPSYR
ncbi:TPA: glucose-6-phosphate isomerase [Candidatus Acetothermia bacterium]|nr:glucose-6-phosphate isomerase [Candidatus Acetothermia bacterium]HAZ30529.1 glucose-6-phosphate isomerase [Candidatus Acetothermia bacterium]